MALTPGTRLGAYEVTAQLGAGGMGEVYRARDSKLGREVALKVLPDLFVSDPERVARFQREAKTLAALNHPNIGGIHGLEEAHGVTALVLELVEGPTLADRIAQGAIPVDEALPIARQIAEALEAAHEQGIIHRDLKPANIKIKSDGTVKVLDFGLAKALAPDSASSIAGDVSQSPTITSPAATRMGMIMGTAAYMSPEQARGKPVDKRADIWAFGCVLHEMLTGTRTFGGDEVSDILASVLAREPDLTSLPATTPASIHRLLRRCLQKDRNERLRDIGDARLEIRDAVAKVDPEMTARTSGSSGRERVAWMSALAFMTLIAAVAVVRVFRPAPQAAEARLEITTPPTSAPESLAISPDGRTIAFVATADSQPRLWLRSLESSAARPLIGTDGAQHPFWSPDGRSLGFFADSDLKRIDIAGGSVRTLASVYRGTGGSWNREGVIVFSRLGTAISRVADTGGESVDLMGLVRQGSNFSPHFLPDGRRFLYFLRGTPDVRGVYVGHLDGTAARRLIDADAAAVYAPSGHLLFVRQRSLFAQKLDLAQLELTGTPVPVAESCSCAGLSVSDTGSIVYRTTSRGGARQFVWFDRSGQELGKLGDAVGLSAPSLSLDGQRVAGYYDIDGNVDVWVLDTRRGVLSRFTSDGADDVMPIWSANGDRIIFASNRKGSIDLYQKPTLTGSHEQLLLASPEPKVPSDWSPDGRFVLFDNRDPKQRVDIWALPLDGQGKPFPVVQTDWEEQRAQFSPDGRWIAYQSDESGREEIQMQRFPEPGNKWTISTNGGTQVRWRRDGKELFYLALDGRLMAVPIRVASDRNAPDVGTPVPLFVPPLGSAIQQGDARHQFVVSADGQRFLMVTVSEGPSSPITVILNWRPQP